MTTPTEPIPTRSLWKIAAVLIVIALVLGGFTAWKLSQLQKTAAMATRHQNTITRDLRTLLDKGRKVAETFLKDVREDRLDEAYAVTTPAFRAHTSRDAFAELISLNPPMKQDLGTLEASVGGARLDVDFWNGNVKYTRANMDCHTTGTERDGQKARIRLILVAADEKALVDELFIEGLVRGQ